MKKYLIIILLLIAGTSYAQPPHIDSMYVDESKSELQIHGDFGGGKGRVWVDSVEMVVKNWMDSFIIVIIPSLGRGIAGPVVVGSRGYRSESRILTLWGIGASSGWYRSSNYYLEYSHTEWKFYWRVDIDSRLRKAHNSINYYLHFDETYDKQYTYHLESNYPDQKPTYKHEESTAKGIYQGNLSIEALTLYTNIDGFQVISEFDSNLIPTPWGQGGNGNFSWGNQQVLKSFVLFPPDDLVLALRSKPMLLLPLSGTTYSYNDGTTLSWDSLSLITRYHLQVSSDSLFATSTIDTTILQTSFALPTLTGLSKYFWRVSGINSEGESRWSDVWDFTTGTQADVKGKNNSALSLSSYPNPSSNELNISYTLPSMSPARILLYNLQGNILRESMVTGSDNVIKWNISGLSNGTYILGLITESERITKMVTVVH